MSVMNEGNIYAGLTWAAILVLQLSDVVSKSPLSLMTEGRGGGRERFCFVFFFFLNRK